MQAFIQNTVLQTIDMFIRRGMENSKYLYKRIPKNTKGINNVIFIPAHQHG